MRYWLITALIISASPLWGVERYFLDDVVNVQVTGGVRQDRLGTNVDKVGDFNGDNIGDFVVSTFQFSNLEPDRDNYAYLVYGTTNLPSIMDMQNPPENSWSVYHETDTIRVSGLGDFNADGLNDLLLAKPETDINDSMWAGEVLVVFGTENLKGEISYEDVSSSIRIHGYKYSEMLGNVMNSSGDFNGDGFDDFLLYRFENWSNASKSVAIIFGGTDVPELLSTENLGDHGVLLIGAFAYDHFGDKMTCAGDVNGDGFDDILIGADARNDLPDRAYLIYGGTDLPPVIEANDLGNLGVVIDGGVSNLFTVDESGVGDINQDGFSDFVVSTAISSPGGLNRAGEVFVIFGGADLPETISLASFGNQGIRIRGSYEDEALAVLVAGPANWNGDEYPDFALAPGVLHHEVYLMPGGPSYGEPKSLSIDQLERSVIYDYDPITTGFPRDMTFLGDINGDGLDDLGVADWFLDYENRSSAGAVYIFYGGQFFPTVTPTMTPTKVPSPTKTPIPEPSNTPTPTLPQTRQYQGWILYGDGEVKKVQN